MRHALGTVLAQFSDWLKPETYLETGSYLVLWGVIFAETGLFIGFFLPGDSLLFTAGVFAAKGDLNIWLVTIGCFIAAVLGDQVGYLFGRKVGPSLFSRPDARLFKQAHVHRAQLYFEEHGPKTIILARFVPIVRTFAPIVAGVAEMDYRTFLSYNVIGALLWAVGISLLGFFAGEAIGEENIDKYLLPIIAVIIIASVIPAAREMFKHRKAERERAEPAEASTDTPD
jgi:membrane-associated protein